MPRVVRGTFAASPKGATMAKRNTSTSKSPANGPAPSNPLATHAAALAPAQAAHVGRLLVAGGLLATQPANAAALAKALTALAPAQLAAARRMLGNSPSNHAVTAMLVGPAPGGAASLNGLLEINPAQCKGGYYRGRTAAHDNWILVQLCNGNPKRVGSQTHSRWSGYKFGQPLSASKHMPSTDIDWDLAHHLIGLQDPAKASKAKAPATHVSKVGKGKPVTLAGPAPKASNTDPAPAPATPEASNANASS